MGNNGKRNGNKGFASEPIENAKKTQVLRWNQWKMKRRQMFYVGTYGKRKENKRAAWKPIENVWKTQVLRRNLWNTQGQHSSLVDK